MNSVDRMQPVLPDEMRALVDALPVPVALLDAQGRVAHANAAMRARAADADPASLPGARVADTAWGRWIAIPPEAQPNPQMQRLASLGFMLAGVCHEVSNPLTAIHSMVQILQSPRGATPETIEKGLGSIAANIARVLAITRKLGGFSRVTDDPPRPQQVDAAVREALALLRDSKWGDGVQVAYHGLPGAVTLARPGELQQVLFNAMLNAAQAMSGRGSIDVRAERAADNRIRVRVRDEGPGFPEDHLARVFEPFFTTKPPGEGTGLGLAISYEIVQELGGSMSASNDPGGGACLELVLPGAQ